MDALPQTLSFSVPLHNLGVRRNNIKTGTVAHSKSEYIPTLTGYTHTVNKCTIQIKKDKHGNITIPIDSNGTADMVELWTNMSLDNLTKSK